MSGVGPIWPEGNSYLSLDVSQESPARQHPVTAAIIALRQAVLADAAAWVVAKPGRAAIEVAARRICREMHFDIDDEVVAGSVNGPPTLGPKKTLCFYHPLRPAWMLYIREAAAALGVTDI